MANLAFPISKTRMSLLFVSKCLTNKGPVSDQCPLGIIMCHQVKCSWWLKPYQILSTLTKFQKHHHPPGVQDTYIKNMANTNKQGHCSAVTFRWSNSCLSITFSRHRMPASVYFLLELKPVSTFDLFSFLSSQGLLLFHDFPWLL